MRTTLTLDDDVADRLRKLAARRQRPFKEIVNAVLRRGLSAPARKQGETAPFRLQTFRSALRPGIDPLRLNQLADELDVERGT